MVVILNLNMTIDKIFSIADFAKGYTYRMNPDIVKSGGKGANVARAFSSVSDDYVLTGFCCGYTGKLIMKYLSDEGLKNSVVYQRDGESRICISVVDKYGISTDINEEGPFIKERTKKKYLKVFDKLTDSAKICVISGRTPAGISQSFYSDIFKITAEKKISVFADLTSPYAVFCLKNGCVALKINAQEFFEISGFRNTPVNVYNFYMKYEKKGLRYLIITDGSRKTVAVCNGRIYLVYPPEMKKIICSVGAGDSFMAGFVYATLKNMNIIDRLKIASAFSAADIISLGAGDVNKSDIDRYFKAVRVEEEDL